jgi:hypothetical protein
MSFSRRSMCSFLYLWTQVRRTPSIQPANLVPPRTDLPHVEVGNAASEGGLKMPHVDLGSVKAGSEVRFDQSHAPLGRARDGPDDMRRQGLSLGRAESGAAWAPSAAGGNGTTVPPGELGSRGHPGRGFASRQAPWARLRVGHGALRSAPIRNETPFG